MYPRKRLLRANQKRFDSFDQCALVPPPSSNLIKNIKNDHLYLKLVGIALQLSKEAGVTPDVLHQLEYQLLEAKGLQQHSMLNTQKEKQINQHEELTQKRPYDTSRKYATPGEQLSFLNRMDRELQEVETKEHIIYALKQYIETKKKAIAPTLEKQQNCSRTHMFLSKVRKAAGQNKISRANFYGQTLRQIIGRIEPKRSITEETLKRMVHLKTVWGHTFFGEAEEEYCPVYNAIFDKSEKLIITGGEDGKIKIWGRNSGGLISSLQGHKEYINKIAVTNDNKVLMSAGNDGVRFFDLENMNSLGGFAIESIMDVGEVVEKHNSTSSIVFANDAKFFVLPKKQIKICRSRRLQIFDFQVYNFKSKLSESSGNTNTMTITDDGLVFLGFIEGQIIIFDFKKLGEAKIDEQNYGETDTLKMIPQFQLPVMCVLNAHEGDILEIKWNPVFSCFSTGAKKDGVCKIWQFRPDDPSNRPVVVKELKIPKYKIKRKRKQYNCNFGCWNSTFTHITCSFEEQQLEEETENRGDGEVIVYNARRMEVTWELSKSIDLSSIRAMDSHPFDPSISAICDSFGKIILINIFENCIVNLFEERAFHLGHPSFCLVPSECRFSQDGLTLLVATEYGNYSIYGYDIKSFYEIYPTQQKFEMEYQQFDIDQATFLPVPSIHNAMAPVDVNNLPFGQLQNMKHQNYTHIRPINPKLLMQKISSIEPKMKHHNELNASLEEVERISESESQFRRLMEVFHQNMEEIQSKRMAVLFEEAESREAHLKELINEKVQRIKEIDQNISANLLTNSLFSHNSSIIHHSQDAEPYNEPTNHQNSTENNGTGRRGRGRPTRNGGRATTTAAVTRQNRPSYVESESQESVEEDYNAPDYNENDSEEYQGEVESEDDAQSFEDEPEEDENQSGDLYEEGEHQNNRRRNRQRRRPVQRETRPLERNPRRRPARVEIEELEQEFEEHMNEKRKMAAIPDWHEDHDQGSEQMRIEEEQAKRALRSVANRTVAHSRSQKKNCDLCQFKESSVCCGTCQNKNYCLGCKNSRGKIHRDSAYTCFECIYRDNSFPELTKNISCEKYSVSERSEELFIPQIGEQVAYFFQGYEQLLYEKIESLNNKFLQMNMVFDIVPHEKNPAIINIQKCQVVDIHYAFPLEEDSHLTFKQSSNRVRGRQQKSTAQDIQMLVSLKSMNGEEFKVFFLPGYEHIIKWEIYDDIMKNNRFGKFVLYSIADLKGEEIQIEAIKPFHQSYSNSIWKNIIVHKSDAKYLRRSKREKGDEIAVNIWNITGFVDAQAFQYKTFMDATVRENYKNAIAQIQENEPQIWSIFYQPVDTNLYPKYSSIVEVSMYLQLIIERLSNNYYASEKSFCKDVNLMLENCISFNSKEGYYTELAQKMVKVILEGENFQNDNSTEKKVKTKKKFNSGSSHREEEIDRNRKKNDVKVSKFEDNVEPAPAPRRLRTNRHLRDEVSEEDDDYIEEMEDKYEIRNSSSEEIIRPFSRRRRAQMSSSYGSSTSITKKEECRVTRSRTRN